MATVRTLYRHWLAALLVAGVVGCGEDLTLPDPSAAGVELNIVSGNSQSGTVGEELELPLTVKVVDSTGAAIADLPVAFVVTSGDSGGQLEPDTARTGADGLASSVWVLGTVPGQRLAEARVLVTGDPTPRVVTFQATGLAGTPDTIRAVSPLVQPGQRNQPVVNPPVVLVVDRFGNPVANAEVEWQVSAGGGVLSDSSTATEADGTASATWTLGDQSGVQKVTVRLPGVSGSPITFSATVLF
jgi:hypothetical protein